MKIGLLTGWYQAKIADAFIVCEKGTLDDRWYLVEIKFTVRVLGEVVCYRSKLAGYKVRQMITDLLGQETDLPKDLRNCVGLECVIRLNEDYLQDIFNASEFGE